jgi:hypothetical protein
LIDHSRAMVGDTLIGIVNSYLSGGETDTIGGITLSNLDTFLHDSLRFCYLYTTISNINIHNSPYLRIYDVAVMITYDSLSYRVTDSVWGMSSIVEQDGGNYLYDLSLATLHTYGFLNYHYYSPFDSIKVMTYYRVDSNFTNPIPGYKQATVDNWIWLTGIKDTITHNPYTFYNEAGTPYTSLTDSSLYWCEAYGGMFYFYAVNINNTSSFSDGIGNDFCSKYAICEAQVNIGGLDIGGNPNHVFPFEFRQPPVVDTIKFILPVGYHIDRVRAINYYPYFVFPNWHDANAYYIDSIAIPVAVPYTLSPLGDSLYNFCISPKYTYLDSLVDSLPNAYNNYHFKKDSFYIPDEFLHYELYVYITPICNTTADTSYIVNPANPDNNILPTMVFNDTTYNFLGSDSLISVSYLGAQELILPDPTFELIPTPPLITADQRYNCWTFYIANTGGQDMDNVWANIYSPSGQIILDAAYNNVASLPVNLNGIIDLDSVINGYSTDTFKICVQYICISDNVLDSVKLFYGWNCFGYPESLSQPTLCNINSTWLQLQQDTAFLEANFAARDTVATNCENTQFQLLVNAPAGNVYDFTIQIILPIGTTYDVSDSSHLVFPNPADTTTTVGPNISGDTLRWNIDSTSSALANDGIGGGSTFQLLFSVTTHCIYTGTIPIQASITGISYCGDNLNVSAETSPVHVTNCYTFCSGIVSTNDSCHGEHDGTAYVIAIGGTPPLTYLWSNSATTDTITGLAAGTYTVTVTDDSLHTTTATAIITQPSKLIISSHGTLDDTCNIPPIHTGVAYITASGGTPGYTYLWMPSGQTTETATGLMFGNYNVTVTDVNGCTATYTDTVGMGSPNCTMPSVYDSIIMGGTLSTSLQLLTAGRIYIVTGTIIIPQGLGLTVNGASGNPCILKFAPTAMLILERGDSTTHIRGASLDLKCAKLTGWGDCSWGGVDVQGWNTIDDNSASWIYQGYVLFTESTIENARSAFYMGNRTVPPPQQPFWTGGIIQGDYNLGVIHTYFHNNTMSITFPAPYPFAGTSYTSSYIVWSNFFCDKDLPDPCYSRPLWFIKTDSTSGVTINNDSFLVYQGNHDYSVQDSTYGILDTNSNFSSYVYYGYKGLTNNTFLNVNNAIDMTFTVPTTTGNNIHSNTIKYSQTGISITNGFGDTVRDNTVKYDPLYSSPPVNGIITNNTQNISIRDNIIDSLQHGITVSNCQGIDTSKVWNNSISNCTGYGIGTGGNNGSSFTLAGLYVYCNLFDHNDTAWSGFNSPTLPIQGNCQYFPEYPPGNKFGSSSQNSHDIVFPVGDTLIYKMDTTFPPIYTPYDTPTIAIIYNVSVLGCLSLDYFLDGRCSALESDRKEDITSYDSSFNSLPFLGNPYPNPFNNYTEIPYYLPLNTTSAEIDIFDVLGNLMMRYPLNTKGIQNTLHVNSETYSGGFYFCILIVDDGKAGWKKLVIIK